MRNRRAFLSIVLTAATATAVYAEPTRFTSGATRSSATVTRELPSPAAQVAWMQVIALYPSAIGISIMRLPILIAPPAEILGIQDGPDGVDSTGIKGIAPKQKDEGDPPTLP